LLWGLAIVHHLPLMNDLGTVVEHLDITKLRFGAVHRLRLQLTEDGAGFPVALPILVARGRREGPTLGIVAAVHGDEINGVPVVHKLFENLDPRNLAGTVIAAPVVNIPAFERQQRRFLDDTDLNQIMPGKVGGSSSEIYSHRLIERLVRRFDYMIDLHTASRGRVNSLYARADLEHPVSAKMAHLLRPQIILHSRPRDGSVRGEANELGIPSVTLEVGNPQQFQTEYIRTSVRGIRAVMAYLEMTKARPRAESKEPILCRRSFWTYTDHGGFLRVVPRLCERVTKGELLATLTNVFGDLTHEYNAPEAGVIIGKAVNPVGHTGARIAHIGVE